MAIFKRSKDGGGPDGAATVEAVRAAEQKATEAQQRIEEHQPALRALENELNAAPDFETFKAIEPRYQEAQSRDAYLRRQLAVAEAALTEARRVSHLTANAIIRGRFESNGKVLLKHAHGFREAIRSAAREYRLFAEVAGRMRSSRPPGDGWAAWSACLMEAAEIEEAIAHEMWLASGGTKAVVKLPGAAPKEVDWSWQNKLDQVPGLVEEVTRANAQVLAVLDRVPPASSTNLAEPVEPVVSVTAPAPEAPAQSFSSPPAAVPSDRKFTLAEATAMATKPRQQMR